MLAIFDEGDGFGETLRFLEESIPFGIFQMELPSRKMRWSAGIYQLLGLEPATHEPTEETLIALIHPADQRARAEVELNMRNAMPLHRDLRMLNPRGQLRWVRLRSEFLLDAGGKPCRMIGVLLDVSAEYEAQHLAAVSQRRFEAMAAICAPIWWSAGPEGQIERIAGWEELTGQSVEESRNWGWIATVHPDDVQGARESHQRALDSASPCEIEMRVRRHDGSYRWMRARSVPIHGEAGEVTEWIGSCVDIHATKVWPEQPKSARALSGAQIRAGRSIANWSVKALSETTGVPVSTIRRIEEFDGPSPASAGALEKIHAALSQAGVDFVFPPSGKPAVRPT